MLRPHPALAASQAAAFFPAQAGPFTLRRTWDERFTSGTLLFHWAEYTADRAPVQVSSPAGAALARSISVSVGVAPTLGAHDSLLCHVARGEDWLWNGALLLPTKDGRVVGFSGSFFQQATDYLEATTVCTAGGCGQTSPEGKRFGFVYSRPRGSALLGGDRPIPVLLRAETTETAVPPEVARAALTEALQQFSAGLPLDALLQPYREVSAR
jgi:exosortase J